jgi:hypothetical protein
MLSRQPNKEFMVGYTRNSNVENNTRYSKSVGLSPENRSF